MRRVGIFLVVDREVNRRDIQESMVYEAIRRVCSVYLGKGMVIRLLMSWVVCRRVVVNAR
jgi:hypothetical protein